MAIHTNNYPWSGVEGMDSENKNLIDSNTTIDPSFSQSQHGNGDDSAFNGDHAALAVAKAQQAQAQAKAQGASEAQAEQQIHSPSQIIGQAAHSVVSPVGHSPTGSGGGQGLELGRQGRPLNNTKRAQQNRQAQRAFRQRKELYIKDVEAKVTELKSSKDTIDALRQENIQLRDYILALQSRLIEHPGGVPTPPAVYARQNANEMYLKNEK